MMKVRAALFVLVFLAVALTASAQRRSVQVVFGSETPIRRSVRLSADVLKQIAAADPDLLGACDGTLGGKVTGSAVDINGDGVLDLVVQGTDACAMGAHSTNFWVFSKSKTRFGVDFDLILSGPGDILEIGRKASNAYRDVTLSYHTALEMYSTIWKFNGGKYQPRECFIEDFKTNKRQRTPCRQSE
jgi:hypothetical protein